MKIYSNINNEFNELDEISFLINDIEELINVKDFLEVCIKNMQHIEFSHEHLSDYLKNKKNNMPEIIICKEE